MNIFIAGGTSGIGFALAQHYCAEGNRVGICGRDLSRILPDISENIQVFQADVSEMILIQNAVNSFMNDNENLDLFINCAGSYAEDVAGEISYSEAEAMLKTNILGTINCFEVARKAMKDQKSGQIAVIASVSAILDYENSSLYTKTKRATIQIADAYHRALKPFGISLTIIAPGYIDTQKLRDLNSNNLSKKPFVTDVETATKIIADAITNKRKLIIFPNKMKWMMKSLSYLPSSMLNLIMFRKATWMKND